MNTAQVWKRLQLPKEMWLFNIYYTPRIERTFTGATSYFWNRKGLLRVVSCKVFWGSNSPFWLLTTTCLFVLNVFDLWRCSPINLPLPLSIYVIYMILQILQLCAYINIKDKCNIHIYIYVIYIYIIYIYVINKYIYICNKYIYICMLVTVGIHVHIHRRPQLA